MFSNFTKNFLFSFGTFLIISTELLAEDHSQAPENESSVLIVRNKLNPDQYFLAEELAAERNISYDESLSKVKKSKNFPFFSNQLFFHYDPTLISEKILENYEKAMANPSKVWVYNKAFRITLYRKDTLQDQQDYEASRILLEQYIAQQKLAADLKKRLKQEETILYHPLTGAPFAVPVPIICGEVISWKGLPSRWKLRHYAFQNEIPILPLNPLDSNPTNRHESIRSIICRRFCTKAVRYTR